VLATALACAAVALLPVSASAAVIIWCVFCC
jgi:hypothetical protein